MSISQMFFTTGARPLTVTETHVVSVLFMRRARTVAFGEGLFSDHAWDILLELYATKLAGRSKSLAEIMAAIELPTSTATRWIAALEERGLVEEAVYSERPSSPSYRLTQTGASKMESLADQWASAFVSI